MWTEFDRIPSGRRDFLKQLSAGFGYLGLASMLGQQSTSGSVLPPMVPRAKRVIFLFMNGGPCHFDTLDPKPNLKKFDGKKLGGRTDPIMASPFGFQRCGQSGIEISDTLPNLGRIIDDCCVIRSMHTDVPNHEPALLLMQTGNLQPIRPSLGSWTLYGLGSENENLPGFVVLRPTPAIVGGSASWGNSFLPAQFQATDVITANMAVDRLVSNIRNPLLAAPEQLRQIQLIQNLNRLHVTKRNDDIQLEAQIKSMETAYKMQSAAAETFDISKEPPKIREMYGDTVFGRSCLLARRLAESGVRFTTVYYTGGQANPGQPHQPWDTHGSHNANHQRLAADSDRASAALITDLKQRGLLEDTLVIWGGEFGRTPWAQEGRSGLAAKRGRNHLATGFSMLLAGGGVKGGLVHGATDELGAKAVENPVHIHDLHATILHLLGIDHEALTYRYAGRDFRLTDVHGDVVRNIMA